ncbi:hypothetical protein [uncultured Bradyrhizobium sp.]|uniref:hypothetical protein n=1 Tax=uncultured Bradyrhizobium sp. TaxID=199684 RepID=UPI0035C9782D
MVVKFADMKVSRWLLTAIGGFGMMALSFVGTLYAIDMYLPGFGGAYIRDQQRVKDAALLKGALENYHKARGGYPNFTDNPVSDLKKDLVDGGFLKNIPEDPSPEKRYRYTNNNPDGRSFGLLVPLEGPPGECVTVVGINPGWWVQASQCPF